MNNNNNVSNVFIANLFPFNNFLYYLLTTQITIETEQEEDDDDEVESKNSGEYLIEL